MDIDKDNVKKYIVIVRLGSAVIKGSAKPNAIRVSEAFGKVNEQLLAISGAKPNILFTDTDGITAALLIKSYLPAGIIKAKLSGDDQHRQPSILLNDDAVAVIEIGEDHAGFGPGIKHSALQLK
ncbi:hypothetical protein [Shewanella xiamenensis]|uniref:hypothetical protein n=1 Tax=Shewanella xiamenensis TaxID=332186 RepID=UPI00313C603F